MTSLLLTRRYCCATAQSLTIQKALSSGTTSKLVLAKLAVDTWQKYEAMIKALKELPEWAKGFDSLFKMFLPLAVSLSKASSYKFMGQSVYEEEKYGVAVSYLTVASDTVKTLVVPTVT